MLLDHLVAYCDKSYTENDAKEYKCKKCTHPVKCTESCRSCLQQVHFDWSKEGTRKDYNCSRLLDFYTCCYSYKYTSEIVYALKTIELNDYPYFNVMSLGCGAAPDLMAFEYVNMGLQESKPIEYTGYDRNVLWKKIHAEIESYFEKNDDYDIDFYRKDIFGEFLNKERKGYNVIVLQYLISHLYNTDQINKIDELFDYIVNSVLQYRDKSSPFLVIINDIDTYHKGRNYFWKLAERIESAKYKLSTNAWSFNAECYLEKSKQHPINYNIFSIPEDIKKDYDVAILCTSAQLILEVR